MKKVFYLSISMALCIFLLTFFNPFMCFSNSQLNLKSTQLINEHEEDYTKFLQNKKTIKDSLLKALCYPNAIKKNKTDAFFYSTKDSLNVISNKDTVVNGKRYNRLVIKMLGDIYFDKLIRIKNDELYALDFCDSNSYEYNVIVNSKQNAVKTKCFNLSGYMKGIKVSLKASCGKKYSELVFISTTSHNSTNEKISINSFIIGQNTIRAVSINKNDTVCYYLK